MIWMGPLHIATLPGFGISRRATDHKLKRMGVTSRPRRRRGGGREYAIDDDLFKVWASGLQPSLKPHLKLLMDGSTVLLELRPA